LIHNI